MPLLFAPLVSSEFSLVRMQSRTVRQRLQRLAARVAGRLLTVWRTWFTEARQGLDMDTFTSALTVPHLLDAEQVVMGQWQDDVEQPARAELPFLWLDVLRQVGEVVEPEMADVAGQPVQVHPLAATQQATQRHVGGQIAAVTQTTLLGVRYGLREGRAQGLSAQGQAQRVQQRLGLTPSQVQQLDAAQARWRQEGRSAQQIQTATEDATARGLSQRLRAIAQTQAYGAVNLTHRLAMTQAALTGPQGAAGTRRYWHVQPGACALICTPIPGMNPQGVALDEAFDTPNGPVTDPPMHIACRCTTDYRAGR